MVQIAFGQGRGELVADGADGFPPETGGDGGAAVDAGKRDLFRGAALFNGGDDGRGEILFQMGYAADTGVAGGENAVGIRLVWLQQAVGRSDTEHAQHLLHG